MLAAGASRCRRMLKLPNAAPRIRLQASSRDAGYEICVRYPCSLGFKLQKYSMPSHKDHGPQIKDDARYEALREQGASKEKAARIANTDPSEAGRRGGKSPPYEQWTKRDLYRKAQEIGISGRSGLSKAALIEALRRH
jgi:hypothetical protein